MFTALLQSLRYLGHFYPLAFLRIYLGFVFLSQALERKSSGFLDTPHLAAMIEEWLPQSTSPTWLQVFYESTVVPQWQLFSYIILFCEMIIGLSYILGFGVRSISWIGIILCFHFIYISSPLETTLYKILMATFFTMAWLGAGRCLGIDYYFFKRVRGIWW